MKSTGMVRKIDNLGRVVVPKEIRNLLDFDDDTQLEILIDEQNKRVIFEKFTRGCIFCGEMNDTIEYEGQTICTDCAENIFNKTSENK